MHALCMARPPRCFDTPCKQLASMSHHCLVAVCQLVSISAGHRTGCTVAYLHAMLSISALTSPLLCCAVLCSLKSMSPRLSSTERTAAVDEAMEQMRRSITAMAGALGADHLLVSAATRYMAQLSVMLGQRQ